MDAAVVSTDYKIRKCNNCSLEFADPMMAGSDHFYEWITAQSKYYPSFRQEYNIVHSLVTATNGHGPRKLIDIGCGSGDFLEMFKGNKNVTAFGMDTTESSVRICREKGLQVECCYLEDVVERKDSLASFDFVTAFHVLEHVPHPLQFVSEMKTILKPDGNIFLSTPYSPMSFETDWFDPLNHPPHHMTRWNEKAYRKLAEILKMKIEFFYPETVSLIRRVNNTYKLKHATASVPSRSRLQTSFKAGSYLKILTHQIKRSKVSAGITAPDLVLVKLSGNA
jgi:2-polyprenyl-3-methyl-5-hydroxy-6-metoxy-1,4-benzoquinol methylase